MKPIPTAVLAALSTSLLLTADAANYLDATGDFTGGSGFLDMTSVEVSNTGSLLTFRINLASDPSGAGNNWASHLIGFDTTVGGTGNINATGGWAKDIQMSQGGMDFFIGNWLNNGTGNPAGAALYTWSGSAWNAVSSTADANPFNLAASVDATSVTISFDFAALSLSAGDSFNFDVYSSDTGGDNVLDALGSSTPMTWNSDPYDSAGTVKSYTIAAVPEPSVLMFVGIGSMLLFRRKLARV